MCTALLRSCVGSVSGTRRSTMPYRRRFVRAGAGGPSQPPGLDGVQLRPGRPSDLALIRSFVLSEKINPLGLDPLRFTIAEAPVQGAECVVGIVQTVALEAPNSVELRTLVVRPSYRGQGLGSRLVSTQLDTLCPGTLVWLTTVESRQRFYERLGFIRMRLAEAPRDMFIEVAAGLIAARLLAGQQLVVLRYVVQH